MCIRDRNEILPLLVLIADKNRYTAIKLKNKPSGSDLYQPIKPLSRIGNEIANINDAKRPAVVPPITRTSSKTTTYVNEPIINGKRIVNSKSGEFPPKIL